MTEDQFRLEGFTVDKDGNLILANVPTSDPQVAGAVWSDSNVLTVSTGS